MADTWGLAKKATSIAVRVLNANGSGSTSYVLQYYQSIVFIFPLSFFLTLLFINTHNSGVIDGINWVVTQHGSGKKSVAKYVTLTSKILKIECIILTQYVTWWSKIYLNE